MKLSCQLKLVFFLLVFIGFGLEAEARRFSFQNESVAAYFRGTGGLSGVKQQAFADSVDSATLSFSDEEPQVNFGGELGFLMKLTENTNLRLGAEILQSKISNVAGSAPNTGDQYLTLTSDIFVFNPMATLEVILTEGKTSRFITYAGLGFASVRLDNEYNINDTGETALGVASYTEKSDGEFINGVVGLGWEGLFTDSVTALADIGYRFLDVNKLKHKNDQVVIDGNVVKGSEVKDVDGSTRTINMGGFYFGLSFRFYIDII